MHTLLGLELALGQGVGWVLYMTARIRLGGGLKKNVKRIAKKKKHKTTVNAKNAKCDGKTDQPTDQHSGLALLARD